MAVAAAGLPNWQTKFFQATPLTLPITLVYLGHNELITTNHYEV
jgi:hypothetical protein